MVDTHVMDLPDRRALSWIEFGHPDGPVVIGLHGTPGSRRQVALDDKPVVAAGVRLICPDRAGYGLSTYHPDRTLASSADDLRHLADHLGIDRFAVVGLSGGGPHAAVSACLLPGRVTSCGLISSVGPLSEPGAADGMMWSNRLITRVARRAPLLVWPVFTLMGAVGRRWPERALDALRRQVPPADAAVLARPEVEAVFLEDLSRASPTSARAAMQDFGLLAHDWGVRFEELVVPVHIWQGDQDRNVPPSHARLLARRIPGAVLHECPGEGHLLVVDHLEEILRTITSG